VEGEVMPAKDKFHDVVVNALKKDGWLILKEQMSLRIGERRLWIDIQAENEANQIILVEVKSYYNIDSPVDFLEKILGQYMLYRDILDEKGQTESLYLAIPEQAHKDLFEKEIGKLVLRNHSLNLLVYNVEREEIVLWIDKP
jgi:hypothetical protein